MTTTQCQQLQPMDQQRNVTTPTPLMSANLQAKSRRRQQVRCAHISQAPAVCDVCHRNHVPPLQLLRPSLTLLLLHNQMRKSCSKHIIRIIQKINVVILFISTILPTILRHMIDCCDLAGCTQSAEKSGGVQCVAFMQCVLMMLNELNADIPEHAQLITTTLKSMVDAVSFSAEVSVLSMFFRNYNKTDFKRLKIQNADSLKTRTKPAELTLLTLRFFSVLLSKAKTREKTNFTQVNTQARNYYRLLSKHRMSHIFRPTAFWRRKVRVY